MSAVVLVDLLVSGKCGIHMRNCLLMTAREVMIILRLLCCYGSK